MVNKEITNKLLNRQSKIYPYQECLQYISLFTRALIEAGESKLINFISIEDFIKINEENLYNLKEFINNFTFAIESQIFKHLLYCEIAHQCYEEIKYLRKKIFDYLITKAKISLNKFDSIPSQSMRAIRALSHIKKSTDCYYQINELKKLIDEKFDSIILNKNITIKNFESPISIQNEEIFRSVYFELIQEIETLIRSFLYFINVNNEKIKSEVNQLKENILIDNFEEIHEKLFFIISLFKVLIKNDNTKRNEFLEKNIAFENKIFIERFLANLEKQNIDIENLEKLKNQFYQSHQNGLILKELLEEEISNLNQSIPKEIITKAKIDLRLNDLEYPLSVAFRESLAKAILLLESEQNLQKNFLHE